MDELRGSPMSVGTLEEMIDDNHAIVSSAGGPEYYVNITSFVDRDQIEPGSTVLLHNKTSSVVGLLMDDVDPLVSVMKVEKAPLETYADIGGLAQQIQEVKVRHTTQHCSLRPAGTHPPSLSLSRASFVAWHCLALASTGSC